MNKDLLGNKVKQYGIFLVLIVLVIAFALASPVFLTTGNIFNILRQISMVGISASGFIFIMLLGGIDLSIGSQMTLFNILAGMLIVKYEVNFWLAFAIAIIVNMLIGLFNGFLVTTMKMPPMVATLSMQFTINGVSYLICDGKPFYGFPAEMAVIGQGYLFGVIPVPVIIMVIMLSISAFVLNRTYFGRYYYAVGGSEETARLSGINVFAVKRSAYVIASLAVSIAGMVMLSRTSSAQINAGTGFEFDIISALVLGGISLNGGSGRIYNAVAGVCIIGVMLNGLILLSVGSYAQLVVRGLVLMIAVAYDCRIRDSVKKKKETVQEITE